MSPLRSDQACDPLTQFSNRQSQGTWKNGKSTDGSSCSWCPACGGPTRYSVSSSLQRAPRRSRCSETQTERDTRPRDEPKCAGKTLPDLIGGYVRRGSSLPPHRIACSQVKCVRRWWSGVSLSPPFTAAGRVPNGVPCTPATFPSGRALCAPIWWTSGTMLRCNITNVWGKTPIN